jgi:hypothetical protein
MHVGTMKLCYLTTFINMAIFCESFAGYMRISNVQILDNQKFIVLQAV